MIEEIWVGKHGAIEKDAASQAPGWDQGASLPNDPKFRNFQWRLSTDGVKEARAMGSCLLAHGITQHDIFLAGTSKRIRENADHITDVLTNDATFFPSGDRDELRIWQHERYLNSRLRSSEDRPDQVQTFLYQKRNPDDESMFELLEGRSQRLWNRVQKEVNENEFTAARKFVALTAGEIVVGFLQRRQGWYDAEIMRAFAGHGDPKASFKSGEFLVLTRRDPQKGYIEDAPRWARRISPLHPERDTEWYPVKAQRSNRRELQDDSLWGDSG